MPVVDGRVPDPGDVFWIEFGDAAGHEQSGRRPALVISPLRYNLESSLVIVCPMTRSQNSWPFRYELPPIGAIRGSVLLDQIRVIDPVARHCRWAGRVSQQTMEEVRARLGALLGLS